MRSIGEFKNVCTELNVSPTLTQSCLPRDFTHDEHVDDDDDGEREDVDGTDGEQVVGHLVPFAREEVESDALLEECKVRVTLNVEYNTLQ